MIVTYLGHQGWSVESLHGHVLIDPVFRSIGNAGVQLPVWPDREVDPSALGPIVGIILSHEHSDHFDIDTLHRMPWRGTVYVSDRSSRSMYELLVEMGYSVSRIRPFQVLEFTGVRVTVLPLDWSLWEPDAYGFVVQGDDGTSFFTSVDGMPHAKTIEWLREYCPQRSVDNFTNNYLEPLPELTGVVGTDRFATGQMLTTLVGGVEKLNPARVVFSGQGWSYPPMYSELNNRFFNVTHDSMLPLLSRTYPHIDWSAPLPGTRIGLGGESADGTIANYISLRPTTARDYSGYTRAIAGNPWSGVKALSREEMQRAIEFVRVRFGQLLNAHAPLLVRKLFELASDPANTLLPTVALRLRDDGGSRNFIFDPGFLEFVPAPTGTDLRRDPAGGVEIWASDLLLLADGKEEPYLVYETAVRRWSNAPAAIGSSLHTSMFLPFGPRLQPHEFRDSYRHRLVEVCAQSMSVQEVRQ
ncbi:MBL fold metallo-hydrolase [Aldersonia sp. NBC_00410]|uniref:MBL fold metallo-hydrolase n=1 Tax=Aldersonia sp. NBC_00410 TaxID=2975954 RepID=UPI002250D16A|nr:MBL fold metallo-hydrolase [Aldersonia sp. NBC_00410]MCX5042165.1 MBL fold metallo-hydrolase [Aldersonia sp. NBC_00410]